MICLLILILLAGLRYRIGSDTLAYQEYYQSIPSLSQLSINYIQTSTQEPGWIIYNSILKTMGLSFYILQLLNSFLINSIIGIFIWKITKYKYFSLLCYTIILYPNFNFEILRQSISIAIFILGFFKLVKKQYIYYFILIFFASMFHYSAIVLFLVPFIVKHITKLINKPFIFLIISIITFALSFIFRISLSDMLLLFPIAQNKTFVYFSNMEESSFNASLLLNLILNVGLPIYIIQFIGKELNHLDSKRISQRYLKTFLALCCISVFSYCLSATLPIFYRINWYFLCFGILLYPYLIDISSSLGLKKKYGILLVLSILVFKGRVYFNRDENNVAIYEKYYPYSSIFNEFKDHKRESNFRN